MTTDELAVDEISGLTVQGKNDTEQRLIDALYDILYRPKDADFLNQDKHYVDDIVLSVCKSVAAIYHAGIYKKQSEPVCVMRNTGGAEAFLELWGHGHIEWSSGLKVDGNPLCVGDYVVKDKDGFHICKADVFQKTYERVNMP
jgi:hypothetical protein